MVDLAQLAYYVLCRSFGHGQAQSKSKSKKEKGDDATELSAAKQPATSHASGANLKALIKESQKAAQTKNKG